MLFAPVVLLFALSSQVFAETPTGLSEYNVIPTHYDLALTINPDEDTFSGEVSIDVNVAESTNIIWLNGNKLTVQHAEVWSAGEIKPVIAIYKQMDDSGVARLTLPRPIPAGPATLRLSFSASFDRAVNGLHLLEKNGLRYAATQFEPNLARFAFPGFDEPGFKVPFDITVTARKLHTVVTNTPMVEETELAGGMKRVKFATTKPLPTYLLAFVVGPYDVLDAGVLPAGKVARPPLPIRGITGVRIGEQIRFSLGYTARILLRLEEYFGIAFPYAKLDSIAAPEFGAGGMENAGAIIYTDSLLMMDEDAPLSSHMTNIEIQAHEIAHQWFGNLVTPKWWSDLWLKESFTQWMTFYIVHDLWPEIYNGRGVIRAGIDIMDLDSAAATRPIQGPVGNDDLVKGSLTRVVYSKGASVLSMFANYMGEEKFRDGIRIFLNRHAHGVASAPDFMQSLADAVNDPSIFPAIDSFLTLPGFPLVTAELSCSARGVPEVHLHQTRYRPPGSKISDGSGRWQIPVCMSLIDDQGVRKQCTILKERKQTLAVGDKGSCPTAIMPNADGHGYYRWSLKPEGWTSLMTSLHALNGGELISLMDSMTAAFYKGDVTSELFFTVVRNMAGHDDWDVVSAPIATLGLMLDSFVPEQELPLFRAKLNAIYEPLLAALQEEEETPNNILLRDKLYRFLVFQTRSPELRRSLAKSGRDFIGAFDDGVVHWEAVQPNLIGIALGVAAQEGDDAFFNALIAHWDATRHPAVRMPMVIAFSRVTNPDHATRIRDLVLLTPGIANNEAFGYLFMQSEEAGNRQGFLSWLGTNDNLQGALGHMPPFIQGMFPGRMAGRLCSRELRNAAGDIMGPAFEKIPGGVRELEAALEEIELCVARKDLVAPRLSDYLSKQG